MAARQPVDSKDSTVPIIGEDVMKSFLHLAVVMAFAMPVFAHAEGGAISQPNTVVAQNDTGGGAATSKKKKGKKKKKKGAAAPAADGGAAEGGK